MSFLSADRVSHYLDALRELGAAVPLADLHVHATEVIRGRHAYTGDPADLMSAAAAGEYSPPEAGPLRLNSVSTEHMPEAARNRLSELMFERAFRHTGARVLADQMEVCGVSRLLLLPVATPTAPIETQMPLLAAMQSADSRLSIGYCVPPQIAAPDVGRHLRGVAAEYRLAAVKLHPNLSGIDPASKAGAEAIAALLDACNSLDLPIVVHGGCSPILGDSPAAVYSTTAMLSRIDWSISRSPVVVAHFGVYGCAGRHAGHGDFGAVNRLLETHSNLYLDTSGVSIDLISAAIGKTDRARLVFGSDALYVPMWQALVSLCHALHESGCGNYLDEVARIACRNAAHVLRC